VESLGKQLRIVRERLGLSQREVARRCVAVSKERGSDLYQITGSWLGRVESDPGHQHEVGAHPLVALLSIYGITLEELLAVNSPRELPEDMSGIPEEAQETTVLTHPAADTAARLLLPDDAVTVPANTVIMRPAFPRNSGRFLRIVIGHSNNHLYPIVPAGTLALVDKYRRSLDQEPGNVEIEIQRPMFLLEMRDGRHICCWCELVDKNEHRAVILFHPTSRRRSIQIVIDRDVSVIGQVVAVRIVTAPKTR
jgi:transcriptional regulator with XRE-family HTH domain